MNDRLALIWFIGINAATFLAFGLDKWLAGRSGQRFKETTLVWLAALGGWPGGLLGMRLFRHKTAKRSFKFRFTFALLPFMAGIWAWWHWG